MADQFEIGWAEGPSAQIDLFSPGEGRKAYEYQLKYTPAFRSVFRRTLQPYLVAENELELTQNEMEKLVKVLGARAKVAEAEDSIDPDLTEGQPKKAPTLRLVKSEVLRQMEVLGERLLDLIIPPYLKSELRSPGLFLELGLDERLMSFPWELMFDGDDFLCTKQAMGRFVNGEKIIQSQQRPGARFGKALDAITILLICVPKPNVLGDRLPYEYLPEAEAERDEIIRVADEIPNVNVDLVDEPIWVNVVGKLKKGNFQIVHFCGHAHFDSDDPNNSSLVLLDRNMSAIDVRKYCGQQPSVLYFVNACETAATSAASKANKSEGLATGNRFDLLTLARAFMESDAYTLGSRWKINDKAARAFAKTFYGELLRDGQAVGHAIRNARAACRGEDEFAWASYVYYGDPRICFRRLSR